MEYVWNYEGRNHESEFQTLAADCSRLDVICPYLRFDAVERLFGSVRPESLRVITLWDTRAFLTGGTELEASKCYSA